MLQVRAHNYLCDRYQHQTLLSPSFTVNGALRKSSLSIFSAVQEAFISRTNPNYASVNLFLIFFCFFFFLIFAVFDASNQNFIFLQTSETQMWRLARHDNTQVSHGNTTLQSSTDPHLAHSSQWRLADALSSSCCPAATDERRALKTFYPRCPCRRGRPEDVRLEEQEQCSHHYIAASYW